MSNKKVIAHLPLQNYYGTVKLIEVIRPGKQSTFELILEDWNDDPMTFPISAATADHLKKDILKHARK